ncbi:MAG: hypothetical protein ACREIA_16915 [Opitutaceae bacterium]
MLVASAQFTSKEPIINFRLPMFNEDGYKSWEVRGSEGRYLEENRIEITELDLQVFSGDEAGEVETTITSPLAIVHPKDRTVAGPGAIHAKGVGFELFGDNWLYEHDAKTVTVNDSVVLTLDGVVGDILK